MGNVLSTPITTKFLRRYWLWLLMPLHILVVMTAIRYVTVPHTQAAWVKQEVAWLQRQQPTPKEVARARNPCRVVAGSGAVLVARFTAADSRETQVSLPNRGVVRLPNGDWLVVVSHSFHDGEFTPLLLLPFLRDADKLNALMRRAWSPDHDIGDLTLIMTQDRQIYYHRGHVCGELAVFYVGELRTTADFLQSGVEMGEPSSFLTWQPLATLAP